MTNFPPEHSSYDPDEPDEEPTGSFPAVGPDEALPPQSRGPEQAYSSHDRDDAFFSRQQPQPPASPDPRSTGQFPAFVDPTAGGHPSPSDPGYPDSGYPGSPDPGYRDGGAAFGSPDTPRYADPSAPQYPHTSEVPQIEARLQQQPPAIYEESEPTGWASGAIAPPERPAEDEVDASQFSDEARADNAEDYYDPDDFDADLPARVRRKLLKNDQPKGKLQRLRSEQDSDSGWTYITLLGAVFVLLIGFSWGCNRLSNAEQSAARNPGLSAQLTIEININGDQASVTGTLPDEERTAALIQVVAQHYEPESIINSLVVNESVSLDDSAIQLSGLAAVDDERPNALEASLNESFEIPVTANSVRFDTLPENLVAISVVVSGRSATITGGVPDQAKLDLVKVAAESIWAEVDVTGLTIQGVQWSNGNVTVSGDIPLGSVGPEKFAEQVRVEGIFVDPGTTAEDLDTATPEELKEAVTQQLAISPILFDDGETKLSADHNRTLDGVASVLLRLPDDEPVKVLGYGDGGGNSASDVELGESRANVVWAYLVVTKEVPESTDFDSASGESPSEIVIVFE